ncbi:MAG TPA: hypothetical protein VGH20_13190 [Myxococcales bacterium]|jgi:hypothetical protein
MKRLAIVVLLAPGLTFAQTPRRSTKGANQQGSGTKAENIAAPGPGIELGTANAMAGGRTDLGPMGMTGIDGAGSAHERALAKANDQARGANEKGSFLRPADTPPQIGLGLKAMGSGAEEGAFPLGGHDYFDSSHPEHGRAGGAVSGEGNQTGGAAAQGSAGKAADSTPSTDEHANDSHKTRLDDPQ